MYFRKISLCILCLCSTFTNAQVGINTVDPKAQLDITSTDRLDPQITDGILIPRITNFPASQPGMEQDGMLVFLNLAKPNFPVGFYFWNQAETRWSPITDNAFSNFYKEGTQQPSKSIDDAIFRNGNIRIGGVTNEEVKLAVTINPNETAVKAGLEIINSNSLDKHVTYGISTTNESRTHATKYGIKNVVSADGDGIHFGIHNRVSQSPSANYEIYGIYNDVGKTFGANKKHYGIYSTIGSTQGNGTVYGIYSEALGTDDVYAGYFAGRVGIGATPEVQYVLPAARGTANQVLKIDDGGTVSWKYPGHAIYTSTESATGTYTIPEETYTLRINNNVNSITIPDANENRGRIIILVSWHGNSHKTFNFTAGDDIYDVTTNTEIAGIDGGQVLKIQSAGNGWTLIDKM